MATGSCLCGGVAFAIDGPLTPIEYCHARRCRKASGSAFAAEVDAPAATLRWLRGEELITVYEAPLLRAPPAYRRAFCRGGSPLPVRIAGTDVVALHAGVLDDATPVPARHIFVAERAPWHAITDGLPQDERHDRGGRRA